LVPRPELASLAFGASAEIGFIPSRAGAGRADDGEATVEAARRVAGVIGSGARSVADVVEALGGEGVGAFEDLLMAIIGEDAVLSWHARGGDPVALSSDDARDILLRLRPQRFAERGPEPGAVGLVLTAGGARGAYEAGVLSVLLPALDARGQRPTIHVGVGGGAINTAFLASVAHLPIDAAVERLTAFWRHLTRERVYRSVSSSVPRHLVGWVGNLLAVRGVRPGGLLDPAPLRHTLDEAIDWSSIDRNVRDTTIQAVGVIALSVRSGRSVVFMRTERVLPAPARPLTLDYVQTPISATHVMASNALPFLFPAVHVEYPEPYAAFTLTGQRASGNRSSHYTHLAATASLWSGLSR
jgi:hypothetical protein